MPTSLTPLSGVFAAAVTPLNPDFQPDPGALPRLLDHLAERGCHGALLFGTTGEGPSFSVRERIEFLQEAARYREGARPGLTLLAGTGCADLTGTIELTRAAFDLGFEGVVTLPAFYYKTVSAAGLAAYFEQIVRQAVPTEGKLLIYHFPQVAGVGVPDETVARLRELFPRQVAGMKDSSNDLAHTLGTARAFPGFGVLSGSDSILTDALKGGAIGCITALANVASPLNRAVWEAHQRGEAAPEAQARLVRARQIVKGLNGPAAMKSALADLFGFPRWGLRPPLEPLTAEQAQRVAQEIEELLTATP
ncbi:MAG: dihydrodipicolinate synthase family protein [Anaerolineales bacterium]